MMGESGRLQSCRHAWCDTARPAQTACVAASSTAGVAYRRSGPCRRQHTAAITHSVQAARVPPPMLKRRGCDLDECQEPHAEHRGMAIIVSSHMPNHRIHRIWHSSVNQPAVRGGAADSGLPPGFINQAKGICAREALSKH